MAVLTQEEVKALFESGDLPTQSDFIDLIDTSRSNSAIKTTTVTPLASPQSVWQDFNETVTLVQTTQQINIILYEDTYYLFNGNIDSYGLGKIQTDALNFIQISHTASDSKISAQTLKVNDTIGILDGTPTTVTTLVDKINTDGVDGSDTFTHTANQVTIIEQRANFPYKVVYSYMFDAEPGVYGKNALPINSTMLSDVAEKPVFRPNIVRFKDVPGSGTVWGDFNNTTNIATQSDPPEIWIVNHNNSTYLFNPDYLTDGGIKWYGFGGQFASEESNFVLLTEQHQKNLTEDRDITAEYLGDTQTIDLDFEYYENFNLLVDNVGGQPGQGLQFTASNVQSGKSGYIKVYRVESTTIGLEPNSFQEPYLFVDSTPLDTSSESEIYMLYETVGDRVIIYSIVNWDRPFP